MLTSGLSQRKRAKVETKVYVQLSIVRDEYELSLHNAYKCLRMWLLCIAVPLHHPLPDLSFGHR